MGKYRKKPVVVEAVQYVGDNFPEVEYFLNGHFDFEDYQLIIITLEGRIKASIGDFIIKGVDGEFYPCKPDIFEKTYEKVGD